MKSVKVLDCTLRDGGYCNQWDFGERNIRKIISALLAANVDIIECGYLTNKCLFSCDVSKYTKLEQLENFIPSTIGNTKFVLMLNVGEYDIKKLPQQGETIIDGIRVAFHKKNINQAIQEIKKIKLKGYQVFVQPMVSNLYSEKEFLELIDRVNSFEPDGFYIVDSFGMMSKKLLNMYFNLADENLNQKTYLGFHSHNNLQSAFSNAQNLLDNVSNRSLIIDTSIYGMGRGAGNLNSELFLNELNNEWGGNYEIRPLLHIMDEVINRFYEEKPWGYSLPNYLSATKMIHPNYANYLSEKRTLSVEDIDEIFSRIDINRGVEYDEEYISDLYYKHMSEGKIRNEHLSEIKEKTLDRKILLIAPGRSSIDEAEKIKSFVESNDAVIISINHEYNLLDTDYIFVSNIRRFLQLEKTIYFKTISTSNIKTDETFVSVDYFELINTVETVRDNAALMAIAFVTKQLGCSDVYIAGLDGYTHDAYANFETKEMAFVASSDYYDKTNRGIKEALDLFRRKINVTFVTTSLLDSV